MDCRVEDFFQWRISKSVILSETWQSIFILGTALNKKRYGFPNHQSLKIQNLMQKNVTLVMPEREYVPGKRSFLFK